MPLAPIRVRGKKKTATKMSSAASSSSKAAADPDGAGTEPKAPKKKARETNFSRRVSILERLPVELLVMVFMESQNMDLLFCSRRLHAALNNHYSHVRLVAQAFAPTWSAGGIRREIECYQKWERGRPCEQDCDRCCEPPPPDKGCQDIVRRQVWPKTISMSRGNKAYNTCISRRN
ncbi:hypothetical protein IMZ48_29505 [Candidatus Bathyarchaeota archaeon]|nr:hypothetical protein [Candidatus Bathyarchaeota archaeon]